MSQPSPYAFVVNGEVFFDPHEGKQREVCDLIRRRVLGSGPEPANVFLRGNRGSGKSRLVRAVLHALALAIPGFKYIVVRRNMPDLRQNHLIYLHREMGRLGGVYHETFGQCQYENGSLGFYRQCEDEKDAEKIVGSEAAVLFVDEAPQIPWKLLRMLGPSLRVAKVNGALPYRTMVIYGGNPIGDSIDELDRYFVEKAVEPWDDPEYAPDDFLLVPIHRADNPSIDEREYRKQFAGLERDYRAAWLDGERIEAGTIFDVFKTVTPELLHQHRGVFRDAPLPESRLEKPYHYIQELPTIGGVPLLRVSWMEVYRIYDHGYSPDPAVCLWVGVVGRRIFAFHEETWLRKIAEDSADAMQEVHAELLGDHPCVMTFIDPDLDIEDGKDVITVRQKMEARGVACEPSINNRVMIADAIHSLLGEEVEPGVPRFQIYEPGCPKLAKYLPKMKCDEKNRKKMADHQFDHWPMCLGYFGLSSGVLSISAEEKLERRPAWMDWIEEDRTPMRRRSAL